MNAATTAHLESVQLEHICSYWATLAPPEVIGSLPEGIRAHFYVTAGEVRPEDARPIAVGRRRLARDP
jgi:hypothetical protein